MAYDEISYREPYCRMLGAVDSLEATKLRAETAVKKIREIKAVGDIPIDSPNPKVDLALKCMEERLFQEQLKYESCRLHYEELKVLVIEHASDTLAALVFYDLPNIRPDFHIHKVRLEASSTFEKLKEDKGLEELV